MHHLDHCGNRMNLVHVSDDSLCEVGHTQADGPVCETLQFNHLIGTERDGEKKKRKEIRTSTNFVFLPFLPRIHIGNQIFFFFIR